MPPKSPDIQAVAICTATDTHAEIIQQAAAQGKHIFCEKPIDLDLQRIQRALAAVSQAGVKFQVGFNRLTSLPAEIGQLAQLEWLLVRIRIDWIVI